MREFKLEVGIEPTTYGLFARGESVPSADISIQAGGQNRTDDLPLTMRLLYQLSYTSKKFLSQFASGQIRLRRTKPLRSGDPPDRRGVPQIRICGLQRNQNKIIS